MTPYELAQNISDYVDDYGDSMVKYDRQALRSVMSLLKELSVDSDGNIKVGIANLKIINKVKKALQRVLYDSTYQKQVSKVKSFINEVSNQQTAYFTASFSAFEKPKVIDQLKETAWNDTVTGLTESGVNENIVEGATDIIRSGIKGGESFYDLNEKVKEFLAGDEETGGALERYSKTYLTDTLHGFSRSYNNLVTKDLDLHYYVYAGALVKTSRPMCVYLEERKYIHESELTGIARGHVDGKDISTAGYKPGTNGSNFVDRCCGFNCHHHCIPVPKESVPTRFRRKFEQEDIDMDSDEQADSRPKRK